MGGYLADRIDGYESAAFESVTVSTVAVGLTSATYSLRSANTKRGLKQAVISVENADIRYRMDGTSPTAAIGHIGYKDSFITLSGAADIQKFEAIRKDGTNAVLRVTYRYS